MTLHLLSHFLPVRAAAVASAASLAMLLTPSDAIQITGLLLLFWCGLILSHRATPFEAILPVDARSIFLTRMSVGLTLTCLPLIAWIVAGGLRGMPEAFALAAGRIGPEIRLLALPIGALAVIVPHVRNPGVLPIAGRGWVAGAEWALLATACAVVIWLLPASAATALLGIAAAGMLAVTWHRMPRCYQLAPLAAAGSGGGLPIALAAAPAVAADRWWRPVLATVIPGRAVFGIVLMALFALTDMWFMYLLLLFVPELIGTSQQRLRWLHTLPVSRAVLLSASLTPAALSLLAVLLVGSVIGPALVPGYNALGWSTRPHEYSRSDDFDRRTMVPLAHWRVAPRGQALVVQAPWGETSVTDSISFPGLTLYNPYSASAGSSDRMIEWQFARASAAMHGQAFTVAQYFDNEQFVAPRQLAQSPTVQIVVVSLAFTFLLLIAWLFELTRWHVLTGRPMLRNAMSILLGALLVSVVVLNLYAMFAHGTQVMAPLAAAFAMRMVATLPGFWAVAALAALPMVAAYSLLHWQAGKSDVMEGTRP